MDLGCGPGEQLDHMDSSCPEWPSHRCAGLFGGQRATVSGNRMRQDATVPIDSVETLNVYQKADFDVIF